MQLFMSNILELFAARLGALKGREFGRSSGHGCLVCFLWSFFSFVMTLWNSITLLNLIFRIVAELQLIS